VKNEERRVKNEERRMKNEERRMLTVGYVMENKAKVANIWK